MAADVRPYRRRSARLPRRYTIVLRWDDREGQSHEELAETELVSRHGGMLLSPTPLKPGDEILVSWPEKRREARARIIYREMGRVENLAELGFEFADSENFWEMEFPTDTSTWEYLAES